ncbi:transporter substrate-binding domain-containing protein [Flexistipes sp.]|uniref:transporter substrate-binding domain-containing protein n=1 Tax=Flexistipes sp. TaxID=3088135 RepID=UPI002E21CAF9|nr:transporter substrate-binding domain-containing protein [Flexistipes sp.]
MKYRILLILLFLFVISFDSFAHQAEIDKKNTLTFDTITIGSEPDYPPYCMIDENGNAVGFSVDLFKAAAAAVDLKVNIKIGIWSKIKRDLAEGKLDALPLVGRTPEREKIFDFTMPYLSMHGAVFVREGTKGINSAEDLKNKEIAVMKGDNAEEFVRRENISNEIYTTKTFEEAFRNLAAGQYDAVITHRVMGLHLLDKMGLDSVKPLDFQIQEFRQDFCFAVQEGNSTLLSRLNEGLSIIIANDTYEKIRLKWFGPAAEEGVTAKDVARIAVYVFIPLFLIMSVIWIIVLRKEVRRRTKSLKEEISRHKNTLEQLRKQKLLLNEMEKISKVGGWEYDVQTGTINWTEGMYNIYGLRRGEYDPSDYKKNTDFYYPEYKKQIIQAFTNTLETGKPYELQAKLVSADNEKKWVRLRGLPEIDNGRLVRVYGNLLDVTEMKLINDEIKERGERINLLLNSTAEGIYGIDLEGRCTFCNTSALELLGFDNKNQVIGKNMHELAHHTRADGSEYPESECKIFQAFKAGKGTHADDEVMWKYDGTNFQVEYFSYPIRQDGEIIGCVVTFWDITQRKEAEQELRNLKDDLERQVEERTAELKDKVEKLNKSQKAMLYMVEDLNSITAELQEERRKLELSNKELEAFAYSVSHDLRAPLRAINGFSGFLMEDYWDKLDEEGKRQLSVIRQNAEKMDALIADILNLSRISRAEMSFEEVDMYTLAKSKYDEIATDEEKQEFVFNVSELPPAVGDENLLGQLWQNLIGNALKYSSKSENKRIEIGCRENNDEVIYYIKDEGAGFNPKYKDKLFGVFQRLHKDNEFEGTGVGLAVVQRIVHRHGGEIWAESEVNKGAAFYFSMRRSDKSSKS